MLVRVSSSLANIAVPLRSVPTLMYFAYLRIVSSCGLVTSCSRARSISCLHRKHSIIFRRVCCVSLFVFRVDILYMYVIVGGQQEGFLWCAF